MSLTDFLSKAPPPRRDSATVARAPSPKAASDDQERSRGEGIKRATSGPINSAKIVSNSPLALPAQHERTSSNASLATPKSERPNDVEEEKGFFLSRFCHYSLS